MRPVLGMQGQQCGEQLRPEAELLLCTARTSLDTPAAARISPLLKGTVDWDYLVKTALQHGTMQLLYWQLSHTCPNAVPEAILAQLQQQFFANAGQNARLAAELVRLLQLFAAQGIPAVPFKGPTLAVSAYGHLAFRQFGDLDILIPLREFHRAKELLLSKAYLPTCNFTDEQEAAYLESQHAVLFVHRDSGYCVDLHVQVTRREFPFLLDAEEVWARTEPAGLGGAMARYPSSEDLLLILCVHGSKHAWGRLQWICDVAELVRAQPGIHWRRTMEQAERLGSRRMLLLGLCLARDLLDVALPDEIAEKIQGDPTVAWLASQVRKHLLSAQGIPLRAACWPVFHLKLRERLRDRVPYLLWCLRYYLGAIVTPNARDMALLRVPEPLSFLYYVLRPIRLTREYGLKPSTYRDLLRQI
jgi:hypothetical protein